LESFTQWYHFEANILHSTYPLLDINEREIQEKGGIEIIVQAMKKFPNRAHLQKNGCGAIKNIVANGK